MQIDPDNWRPLSVEEVAALMEPLAVPWWIAGGWAIDLFLGHKTREHADLDLLILRRNQLTVRAHLSDWQLFKTNQPGLARWLNGEFLERPVNSVWARRGDAAPWSFELMLMDTEKERWVYRRLESIGGPISEMGFATAEGTPYLRPEIQLLYKSSSCKDKDLADLKQAAPLLSPESTQWLSNAIRLQHGPSHAWLDYLSQ